MRTIKNTLIIWLVLAFLLGACAPQAAETQPAVAPTEVVAEQPVAQTEAPQEAATITVIFPKHEAEWADVYEPRIKEFEAETGIKVVLIQSDWDSVADQIIPEMASGGSAYDVVEFDNGWVNEWCGAGWTTPLDEFMTAGYTDGMIPGLVDLFSCPDGTLHGIVWNNDTRFFYYNKVKLEEAGFEKPPATWDEFVKQSQAAIDAGVVKYGMDPYWNQEWSLMNEFHFWAYAFGGEVVDEQGCFLFNKDTNTLAGLEFAIETLQNGVSNPAGLTYDQANAQNLFLSGNSLFFPQGISGLLAFANDATASSVVGEIEIGLVPSDGESLTLPEAFAIPANSQHKQEAWKFIEYMTSKESNVVIAKEIGLLPIWVDLFADPELTALYPHWASFYAQLDNVRGLSTLTWYGDLVDIGQTELHKALAGGQTAQQALENMAAGLAEFECVP
jgi:multiple sugar transport system substrate-binding protein